MKPIIVILTICFLVLILIGLILSRGNKVDLEDVKHTLALTNEELREIGLNVNGQPIITIENSKFGDQEGSLGYVIVQYGDPADIGYTVYLHETKEGANKHYSEQVDTIRKASDRVIKERTDGNPFIITTGGKTEVKDENYLLWYNYEKSIIFITIASGIKESNPDFNDLVLSNLANKITEKVNQTYLILYPDKALSN